MHMCVYTDLKSRCEKVCREDHRLIGNESVTWQLDLVRWKGELPDLTGTSRGSEIQSPQSSGHLPVGGLWQVTHSL